MGRCSEVTPDPEMSNHAEFKFGKCVPDIALYHRDETHFDLLVRDDSRLELLGLLAGSVDIEPSEDSNKIVIYHQSKRGQEQLFRGMSRGPLRN